MSDGLKIRAAKKEESAAQFRLIAKFQSTLKGTSMKTTLTFLLLFLGLLGCSIATQDRFSSLKAADKTGVLRPTGALNEVRSSHTATLLADGKVLIAGGMKSEDDFSASAELYDPATGNFSATKTNMISRRVGHTATRLPDGKILLVGGWIGGWENATAAEIYDPVTDSFTRTGSLQFGRADHTATLLKNGKVLIAGGASGRKQLQDCELYDPQTGSFTPAASLLEVRGGHTAALLPDGRVLLAGGQSGRGKVLASAEIYDPKSNQCTATGVMKAVRYKHAAVSLANGQVLLVGGSDSRDWNGKYNSAELYDPHSGQFQTVANLNNARYKLIHAALRLPDGKVLVAGGNERAEIYDPNTNRFTVAQGSLEESWHFASATLLPDGRALIVGGYAFSKSGGAPASTNKAWLFAL
jgi:hypothetical protein